MDKSFVPYPQHTRVVRLDFNVHVVCLCTTNCPINSGKKWNSGTSPAYAALQSIVLDARLIKHLPNLPLFNHSGNIEVFHNLMLKYCPKRLKFSYEGMYARTQLAVMDHNSNLSRKQALTKNNEARSKVNFSKVTTN